MGKNMDPRGHESGTEFVLDNRKLIIAFLLLIVACGAFFVIGYMEGKRQLAQAPAQTPQPAAESTPANPQPDSEAKNASAPTPQSGGDLRIAIRDQLNWYKNVQKGNPGSAAGVPVTAATTPPGSDKSVEATASKAAIRETPATAAAPKSATPAAKTGKTSYTVQVGAFTRLREAELNADALKSKGFTPFIEEPISPDQFFRVKVGRFDTRAEAVAMQNKLRNAGYFAIIKTN